MSSRAEIVRDVLAVLAEHLSIVDVDETTHLFQDLELDSVQQLTFVVELENHFKICFDEGDEAGIRTISDVVDAVCRRIEAS